MEIIIIVGVIVLFLFWSSDYKVKKTFLQAIESAQAYVLSSPEQALKIFYTQPNHPRKNDVEILGIDYVLRTSTIEENRDATKTVMAYLIAGYVRIIYKYQSNEDVFKMLNKNPKIKEKFEDSVSTTSMFIRKI